MYSGTTKYRAFSRGGLYSQTSFDGYVEPIPPDSNMALFNDGSMVLFNDNALALFNS